MSKNFTSVTAALKATTIDTRQIYTDGISLNGSDLETTLNSKLSTEELETVKDEIKSEALGPLDEHMADNVIHITANERTTWNSKQNAVTGGATTITGSNLTANRALISNSSGKVAVSAVTSTELGYLDGVTSKIQTQINNITTKSMVPNYSAKISVSTSSYTAPSNGYLIVNGGYEQNLSINVNGVVYHIGSAGSHGYESATVPLAKSDVAKVGSYSSMYFVPSK